MSSGCVPYLDYHVPDEDTLLQYAEIALDHSKANGKDRLSFFSAGDYERKLRVLELAEDLQEGVERGFQNFALHYQAQVRPETYDLYGAEALLRFTSPRRGPIAPEEFIPVLE